MMRKNAIRIGVLLLVSLALAFLLEGLQLWSQPPVYENEPRVVQEAELLDLSSAELTNAVVEDGTLKTGGEGCAVLFRFQPARTLSRLTVTSKKHIQKSFPIRVSWSRTGEAFSAGDNVVIEAVSASVSWTAEFPEGDYAALMVETDARLSIRSLAVRDEVTEFVAYPEGFRLWRVAMLTVILFFALAVMYYYNIFPRLAASVRRGFAWLKENAGKAGLRTAAFLLFAAAGYTIVRWLVSGSLFGPVDLPRQFFCVSAGLAAGALAAFPRVLGEKPERLFACFCLLAGSLMACLFPNNAGVNWDAEYHYEQALRYSYLGESRMTSPDSDFIYMESSSEGLYDWEEREQIRARQDTEYESGALSSSYEGLMLNSIYEIFTGAGLYAGRVLHLPWNRALCLGKLFNLLVYTVCGYFAIRRLKSGKMILACILLIPTAVFLASSFSYDPGVTAFLALALSYWFAEWQEPDHKLTRPHAFLILGCGAFACLTKAFYAPVLLFTAFLPRTKWAEKDTRDPLHITRRRYLLLALGAVLVSLIPYILPAVRGEISTDMRGGSSSVPLDQVRYILEDPFRWFRLLFRFQGAYFRPANGQGMLTSFAYQGVAPGWQVLCILLVLLAFMDKKPCDRTLERKPLVRIAGLLLLYLCVSIICLCLYISFTETGAGHIEGVQPRYMLPLLFPLLMLAGSGLAARLLGPERQWKQRIFNGAAFLVSLSVLYLGIYTACVGKF